MSIPKKPRISLTHEKILKAAHELFGTVGFDATKTEMIADGASVSRQTLYEYYRSKEELYEAILAIEGEVLDEKVSQINLSADPEYVLRDIINITFDSFIGDAKFSILDVKLHRGIRIPSSVVNTGAAHRQALENTLSRGKATGTFVNEADAALFQATMIVVLGGFACSSDVLQTLTGFESKSPDALAHWKQHLTDLLVRSITKF